MQKELIAMKQKEMARWLKLVTVLAAAAGVFLVAVLIPALLDRLIPEDSCAAILWLPLVGFCWLTAAPCFACLFQFWGICTRIGEDRSFCSENAAALKRISQFLFADCACYLILSAGIAVLGVIIQARALLLATILLVTILLVGVTLTVLSAALSHLILKAAQLQSDVDLTI